MSNELSLRHLNYFKVLAEELHFRKAAEKLFITQPGLSRQIKQLEDLYQVQLFERNKRNVKLTDAGKFLKEEVNKIEIQLQLTGKKLKVIGEGYEVLLRIGFIGSAAQKILPDLLMALYNRFPLVKTEMEELSNSVQMEMLLQNKLDIGFVRLTHPPSGIAALQLLKEHFVLVTPKDYPLNKIKLKSIKQLQHEKFILFAPGYSPEYYQLVKSIFTDAGFDPQVSVQSVNALTIYKLVENKMGVAIVPASLQYGYNFNVKFFPLHFIPQRTSLSVIWNPENKNLGLKHALSVMKTF